LFAATSQMKMAGDRCVGSNESEAREFVKLLAKMSGGDMSSTILRIYQTLAVELQNAKCSTSLNKKMRHFSQNCAFRSSEFKFISVSGDPRKRGNLLEFLFAPLPHPSISISA
jgi:hypothetical protein